MAKRPVWSWSDVKPTDARKHLAIELDCATYERLVRMAEAAATTTADLAASLIQSVVDDDLAANGEGT